ncbi:GPI-GlcNAc transferase complex, PIG-H component-domain-containing protein [Hypoxylon sp. FL1284]|nr:GPI-GlcNAc transferase complex, PIG-H component-domain-containing protein [Hypoxylon sp. FL1284]
MLTTAPYLRTRRPSPTTAEFIVTTLPPMTIPLRLALAAAYLLRLIAALAVLLLLFAAWFRPPSPPTTSSSPPIIDPSSPSSTFSFLLPALARLHDLLTQLLHSRPGAPLAVVAAALPPWALTPAAGAALRALSRRIGEEERLLVLRGLGVQTSTGGRSVLQPVRTRFIPTDRVADVLVAEGFRGFGVRHYLAVAVRGGADGDDKHRGSGGGDEDRLVVVFPTLLPRLPDLVRVLAGARECLYGPGAAAAAVAEEGGKR